MSTFTPVKNKREATHVFTVKGGLVPADMYDPKVHGPQYLALVTKEYR